MKFRSLIFILLLISMTIARPDKTEAASVNTDGNSEYALSKYQIDVQVNEDNSFLITERITAYFSVAKHGIIRKLPLRNKVVRLNGTKTNNRAQISDIQVNGGPFTLSSAGGYRAIQIGDPNRTVTGDKDYTISYLYNIGKDREKYFDEFYFNLLGNEWDTTISGIEFSITLPKAFDKAKLGFSSGSVGSTGNSNITYSVDGNTITGCYNGVLNAGEALTVRLELPEGYFVGARDNSDLMMTVALIFPMVFAGVAFFMWFLYGRDEKMVETIEFYPPEGFNSAEVGFLYYGTAGTPEVVSLLIYLANKGYISISEKGKSFIITKLKDYDGENPGEELFLRGLFKAGQENGAKSIKEATALMKNPKLQEALTGKAPEEIAEVTSADLKHNFYTTLTEIVAIVNSKANREKVFEKNSLNRIPIVFVMILAIFVLISVNPMMEYEGVFWLLLVIVFPGLGFTVMLGSLIGTFRMPKIFAVVWGIVFGGIIWVLKMLPALLMDPTYLFVYVAGIICVIIMLFFSKHMRRRTAYGNELLGKISGFINFLKTAEKQKLEELVTDNPYYFYDILPFTYVLGMSDKWTKKFESITLQSPDWYSGTDFFDLASFDDFMSSTMASATTAMSSSPSSDSSGGGSSGGGSGGGGGSSW